MDGYLTVDNLLATGGSRSLAEIAGEISTAEVEEPEAERQVFWVVWFFVYVAPFSETDVMEIEEEPEPPITSREAAEALKILQRYADSNANPAVQLLCDKVDDMLAKERIKKLKQKNLLNYFTPNI